MRVTKKVLKESKSALARRLRQLCEMYPSNLEAEFRRCFPHYVGGTPQTPEETRWQLVCDSLERAIPAHWCD